MPKLLVILATLAGCVLHLSSTMADDGAIHLDEVRIGVVPAAARQWAVSPDLRRLAFVEATDTGGAQVVVDGETDEAFDDVPGRLLWSADSRRIAYVGWVEGATKEVAAHAVIHGRRSERYDRISAIRFSGDGSRYGFAAYRGDSSYIVIDGQVHGPFDGGDLTPPVFSPDGQRVFYVYWIEGRGFITSDGQNEQEQGQFCWASHRGAVFSADGRHLAYVASNTREGTRHVVLDGVAKQPYRANGFGPIALSTDGSRLAFGYQQMLPGDRAGDWRLVVDDEERPLDGAPASLRFSPDGARLAARVESRQGREQWVVLDGVAGERYRLIPHASLFSPDGRTCVYVGWNPVGPQALTSPPPPRGRPNLHGESLVVVNGVETARWIAIGRPVFLPDGRLAYGAIDAAGQSFVVLDDNAHPAPFLSELLIKDKTTLHGLSGEALNGQDWAVIRVEITLPH